MTEESLGANDPRGAVVQAVQQLDALGLNRGSTGNASIRAAAGMWITPTGAGAAGLTIDDLVHVADSGGVQGRWRPSSEWQFHQAIYVHRGDVNAVVHTHSTYATALASHHRALPPFHYMVAVAGVDSVPCVPYHTFGSEALSAAVVEGLRVGNACLIAHHGLVTCGPTMTHAMRMAIEIESLCQTYLAALVLGEPPRLSRDEMARVIEKFKTYGKKALLG
jgi:L-fuculose-phosphate aldolase